MKPIHYLFIGVASLIVSGCKPLLISGITNAGVVAAEDRSFGEAVDDNLIYANINRLYFEDDVHDLLSNANVMVRQGRVLLSGKVDKPVTKEKAVQIAWRAPGVREVIDEIQVQPQRSLTQRAQDEWIEKQVEAKLALTKGVQILNYSIEVSDSRVLLLGAVADQQELDNVFAVARRIQGVKEVVSYLRVVGDALPQANER